MVPTVRRNSPVPRTRGLRSAPLRLLAAALTVPVLAVLSACGPAAAPSTTAAAGGTAASADPVAGGTLRFSLSTDPACLDGHAISSGMQQILGRLVYDTLVTLDPDGQPAPYLAESWTVSEDGTTYTFVLREGVTFADGEVLDAEAVKVNLEHMVDPETKSPLAAAYIAPYESSTVLDERTLQVTLEHAYTPFLYVLAQSWLGMQSPEQILTDPDSLCQGPIGTGPFVVESYTPQQGITYTRRADYDWAPQWLDHEGPALLDRIEVHFVSEPVVRFSSLVSGQYDITDAVPAHNAATLEADPAFTLENLVRPGHPFALWFNTARAPFDDLDVRRAFVAAVDVPAINESLGFGYNTAKDNYLAGTSRYYDPSTEGVLGHDPDLADDLLDAAGWAERDDEGYRVKDGERLSVTVPAAESATPAAALVLVQGAAKKAGIEMVIDQVPAAELTQRLYSADYDLAYGYWHTNTTDVLFIRYHSSEIATPERIGQNASLLADPELDDLLQRARQTPDGPEAEQLYRAAQQRLVELVPAMPLWESNAQWAYSDRLRGVVVDTSHPQPVLTAAWLTDGVRETGVVRPGQTPPVSTPEPPRLLLVHAHPDDESIDNGATMAAVAAAGGRVTLVTCTLGEEGEVIGAQHAGLVTSARDALGPHRLGELRAATAALGVGDRRLLGGQGRYRDTGMVVLPGGRAAIPPEVRPDCFAVADLDEAAAALAGVVREVRPHVLLTYEPGGGYGHPDHVMAQRVALRAVDLAAEPDPACLAAWSVPKVYATVRSAPSMRAWLRAQPAGAGTWDPDGPLPSVFVPAEDVTAVFDARRWHAAKAAALRAHASQVTVLDDDPGRSVLALSNEVPQPWSAVETYRLLRGAPAGPRDDRGRETDLFAGTGAALRSHH